MRPFFFLTLLAMLAACSQPCPEQPTTSEENAPAEMALASDSVVFDSARAAACGADDYGMRKYVMAFLYKGNNRDLDSAKAMELQRAHLDNIGRMAEAGKLSLAGPFFGDGDLRGIYIFNVESVEEARALTETDPAIKANSLRMELMEWYGSAALMEVNDIHNRIAKINV